MFLVTSGGKCVRHVDVVIATWGFGMSAIAQRRSTTPWSSGACSRVTILRPSSNKAILSERRSGRNRNNEGDDDDEDELTPTRNSTATKRDTGGRGGRPLTACGASARDHRKTTVSTTGSGLPGVLEARNSRSSSSEVPVGERDQGHGTNNIGRDWPSF